MEEKFQGSVCGGNWWNSSRNLFGSSPCSSAINEFGWFNHAAVRSLSHNSATTASDGGVTLQDVQNPTFPTSDDWNNQELIHGNERSQDYSQIVEAVTGQNSSMNYRSDEWNFIPDSSINYFPLNSASYSYTSSLLQNLFDADSQAQQCLLDNQSMNYSSSPMNSTEFLPKPFWNATAAASGGASFVPSSLSKFKISPNNVNVKGGGTDKKVGNEAAFKRQRIETPSPLPTFKVRKEKLGDRVTALQQLVSPFGKTDTASVLREAIEYIKLLHDQVAVLSTPYMKHGCSPLQHQQACDNIKNQEEPMKDLRSRGLCLVPISSTFPVAGEAPADFWTPTFGGSFRKGMGERKQKEDRLSAGPYHHAS